MHILNSFVQLLSLEFLCNVVAKAPDISVGSVVVDYELRVRSFNCTYFLLDY